RRVPQPLTPHHVSVERTRTQLSAGRRDEGMSRAGCFLLPDVDGKCMDVLASDAGTSSSAVSEDADDTGSV
ncbi:hypothetical protein BaRGS_00027588, partial [Batillaria attramentaria]